ncbi:MAG: TIGR02569 family protein [Streptosporangiaceae bacterium]
MPPQPPPQAVLAQFGVAGLPLAHLGGGQGTSWRAGDLVVKPADLPVAELEWLAAVLPRLECDGFRVAGQRLAADGSVCVGGWCATEYVAGAHAAGRWPEVIAVGHRFHAALRGIARPGFLDQRDSPWAIGDRVAWGELPAGEFAQVHHLRRLIAARRPVPAPSQLIHGDLGGNVLFHDELPPAIIDFSAYWRPVAFAAAIVVADALVWEGADARLLDAVSGIEDFGQHLIRALIYRAVTDFLFATADPVPAGRDADPWLPAVDLACRLAMS